MINWSSFWGAFLGTLLNVVEVALLIKLSKSIQRMLKQFKLEGEDDKWLR